MSLPYATETQCVIDHHIVPKVVKLTNGEIINNGNKSVYTIRQINHDRKYVLRVGKNGWSNFNLDSTSPQRCYTYRGGRYRSSIPPLHNSCYGRCNMLEF